MALAPNLAREGKHKERVRASPPGFGVTPGSIWNARPQGMKGVLTVVSPRSPRPRGMCQLHSLARPGRGQAPGNACGMNTNPASHGVPQTVGHRSNPNQSSIPGSLPLLPHPIPSPSLPLTLILSPIQLDHKFVNFFLIHNA